MCMIDIRIRIIVVDNRSYTHTLNLILIIFAIIILTTILHMNCENDVFHILEYVKFIKRILVVSNNIHRIG